MKSQEVRKNTEVRFSPLDLLDDDSSLASRIVRTDKAISTLSDHVSRYNCVYYAVENLMSLLLKK
jgi:hypothetical protein